MSKKIKVSAEKVRNLLAGARIILRDYGNEVVSWKPNDDEDPQGNLWELELDEKTIEIDFEAPQNEKIEFNPGNGAFYIFDSECTQTEPVAYQFLAIIDVDRKVINQG